MIKPEDGWGSGVRRCLARIVWMVASSGASACADALPADSTPIGTLSDQELVAVCDEVRDIVTAEDRPTECDGGPVRLIVPSNQLCRDMERERCAATVGELRACYEQANANRCSMQDGSSDACAELNFGCAPQLLPQAEYAVDPGCARASAEVLRTWDGVYEVTATRDESEIVYAEDGLRDDALAPVDPNDVAATNFTEAVPTAPRECTAEPPELIEAGASWFVLVTTESSEGPSVVLASCSGVTECQTSARTIRDSEGAADRVGDYRRFQSCGSPGDTIIYWLESFASDPGRSCQARQRARVTIEHAATEGEIIVRLANAMRPLLESSGCGYAIELSPRERSTCFGGVAYEAAVVAAF
jgi:hypothetical protein